MRLSIEITVSMNGALKFRPGSVTTRIGSPSRTTQHLFGLRHREHRAVADDDDDKQQEQGNDACDGGPHRLPPCCGWPAVGCGGRRGVSSPSGR